MSKKINVKNMDFVALSDYNVASVEMVRLTNAKADELAPLREQRKQILADRAKALEVEGAVLDDVLRQFSVDKVDMAINAINFKYAEPLRECAKAQNKVLKLVNPNLFYAYCVSMDSMDSMFNAMGDFTYEKKDGTPVTVKVGKADTFRNCIKALYVQLGASGCNDDKSLNKLVDFHAKRVGGLKFDRKSQDNVFKKKAEVTNGLVRDIIKYLEIRGIVTVAENGAITKVQ